MNMTTKSEQLALATVADPRWAAVVARDPEADGRFFYSVRTTGVAPTLRKCRVAVDDRHRVIELRFEPLRDSRVVGVPGRQEFLLRDPNPLDEEERTFGMGGVERLERVVERRAQDGVDADDAGAEVADADEPAIVIGARGGNLARLAAGDR